MNKSTIKLTPEDVSALSKQREELDKTRSVSNRDYKRISDEASMLIEKKKVTSDSKTFKDFAQTNCPYFMETSPKSFQEIARLSNESDLNKLAEAILLTTQQLQKIQNGENTHTAVRLRLEETFDKKYHRHK